MPNNGDVIYKVVRKEYRTHRNEVLVSSGVVGNAEVIYGVEIVSNAPVWLAKQGYHLLAFSSMEAAYAVLTEFGLFKPEFDFLYEAVGYGKIENLPPRVSAINVSEGRLLPTDMSWPNETVMYKEIKLVKEVPWATARKMYKFIQVIRS